MLKNTPNSYGWPSIVFHWLGAIFIIGLFALGLYMVDLSYYDELYNQAPHWHESLGIVFFVLLLARFVWRALNPKPEPISSHAWQRNLARYIHHLMYLLMFAIAISGYLISTADGRAVKLFDWLSVPAVTDDIHNLAIISGNIHYWLSIAIIALTVLHIAAAIKHHLIDKDQTLIRMIK